MPTAVLPKSSTPLSTTSSVGTNNTTTAVQSGPYTKAQFQSTMEGSRSVKNAKEIEQLLRDYPAALELYRTGRYKVKVKYEADVERVILVEKRNTKGTSNTNPTLTGTDVSEKNSSLVDISNVTTEKFQPDVKAERESIQSRSRTQSRDRLAPPVPPPPVPNSTINANGAPNVVHTTTSSMRMSSNAQPKVDHHRTPSKDREASVVSQSKQMPVQQGNLQKQSSHRRSQSRESPSVASHVKQQQQQQHHHHQGRKSHRDYAKMVVPYVQNANPMANMWNQQRAVQPYFSNPMLNQQRSSMYVPSTVVASQNALYQPPYSYAQQNSAALTYQKPTAYGPTSIIPSYGNLTNTSNHPTTNYDGSMRSIISSNQAPPLPPSFQTIHANRPPYPAAPVQHPSMYSSQMQYPMGMQMMWPGVPNYSMVPPMVNPQANVYSEHRRSSKHRARSVDTGPRAYPQTAAQGQPTATAPDVEHYHHHHHRHHRHHRPSVNVNPSDVPVAPVATIVTANAVLKDAMPTVAPPPPPPPPAAPVVVAQPAVPVAPVSNGEKLTIRQLNEMFVQSDPSGRLAYGSIPPILQRFGIGLNEIDLSSAAQELQYNVNDPISARRLVHVLVKLGKIAKSNHQPVQQQHQRTAPSPSMLPEDREVTDILTQRQAVSNTMYPSVYPTHWQ